MAVFSRDWVVLVIAGVLLSSALWNRLSLSAPPSPPPHPPTPTTTPQTTGGAIFGQSTADIDADIFSWQSKIQSLAAPRPSLPSFESTELTSSAINSAPEVATETIEMPTKKKRGKRWTTMPPANMHRKRPQESRLPAASKPIELEQKSVPNSETPDNAPRWKRVAFIKTYKTGSTTVAMFLNAVAYQLGLRVLHPLDKGWFVQGELGKRASKGAAFDVSFRHLSPYLDYSGMDRLLPGCLYVSILREPVSRFVSLFNFVGTVREKHKTAERFIAAVKTRDASAVSLGDANSFCNNMAWVLAGVSLDKTMAFVDFEGPAAPQAALVPLLADLETRGVVMLLSDRMHESLVLLGDVMGWNLGSGSGDGSGSGAKEIQFKDFTERVQKKKKYACEDTQCREAILSCNGVDQGLHAHFIKKFEARLSQLPDVPTRVDNFKRKWQQGNGGTGTWAKKYPINCRRKKDTHFDQLHAC